MYGHRSSRSDNKLFTRGIEVLKNTLEHLGHLKLTCYSGLIAY